MNRKQKRFAIEYLKQFNATTAAIAAGYSPRSAHAQGYRLLRDAEIRDYIHDQIERHAANYHERLMMLSDIARNGKRTSDRLRAIELLGKIAGDYVERRVDLGDVEIQVVWGDD